MLKYGVYSLNTRTGTWDWVTVFKTFREASCFVKQLAKHSWAGLLYPSLSIVSLSVLEACPETLEPSQIKTLALPQQLSLPGF